MLSRLFRRKEKTRDALAKTRRGLWGSIGALLGGRSLDDDALWDEVEEALISADVGARATARLVERVRQRVSEEQVKTPQAVRGLLKEEVVGLLSPPAGGARDGYGQEELPAKPFVLLVVGVNGVGKTTSIAKLVHHFGLMNKRALIAAADTFRAAAIQQLRVWGERLGAEVVAHQYGSDPGAVVYDAYQAAVARGADVLVIDTAGRLHTKVPLMNELQKVRRVLRRLDPEAPQQTLLVLDATTGQSGLAQARVFQEATGVDGVFLAKLDGTAKGGIVVAIAQELGLPVLFVGSGEGLEDLSLFDAGDFADALFDDQEGPG